MADGYGAAEEVPQPLSGETTQDSLNLEQLEAQQRALDNQNQYPPPPAGPAYYEQETLSKRDYYTARRNKPEPAQVQPAMDEPAGGKMARCEVIMLDGTAERFDIDRNAKGAELFTAVCQNLDLLEKDYFGITYRDTTHDQWFWLNFDKKIAKQVGTRTPWRFEFQVKFYPPDPENLKEDLTRYYLCLQVRQDIISNKLPCSFITYVLLGSYVVQSEMGDFDIAEHRHPDYIQDMPFCPQEYHNAELLDRINELHKQHKGQTPELADLNFLENSKKLAMYGVDLHRARDSRGEDVYVGVYYGGVLIYRDKLRINRFSWPKIIKISYKRNTFRILVRPNEGEESEKLVEFKCPGHKLAKRLWRAVVDHHGFFRLKNPEKPKRPTLMPGKHRATYSGPTRMQADESNVDRNKTVHRAPTVRQTNNQNASDWEELPTLPDKKKKKKGKGPPPTQEDHHTPIQAQPITDTLENQQYAPAQMPPSEPRYPQQWARRPDLLHDPGYEEKWRLCPSDSTPGIQLHDGGMGALTPPQLGWHGCRANRGVRGPGQFYYEGVISQDGPGRLGWSTQEASLDLGTDPQGYGYGADPNGFGRKHRGRKLHGQVAEDYGEDFKAGDVIGCYLDLDTGMVKWSKNGKEFDPAFTVPQEQRGEVFYPSVCLKDNAKIDFNFGDDPNNPLKYAPRGDYWTPVGQSDANHSTANPLEWRLNPHDADDGIELSPDGHSAQSKTGHGWQGDRANKGVKNKGKYYYEGMPKEPGLSRVGWATENGALDLGSDQFGFGYGADHDGFGLTNDQGKKLHNGDIDNYGQAYGPNDVIGCFVDLNTGHIQWSKNGQPIGEGFNIPHHLRNEAFFPTLCLKDSTMELNFGEKPFFFDPGHDWTPVCRAPPDCVLQTSKRGVDQRKSRGFSYADPRLLQEQLHKRTSQQGTDHLEDGINGRVPGYEHLHETTMVVRNGQTTDEDEYAAERGWTAEGAPIGEAKYAPVPMLDNCATEHTHDSTRTVQSEEYGEPEVEIITMKDEHGNTITKKITKIKKTTRTQVVRTVEGHAVDHTQACTEHPEPSITNSVKRHIVVGGADGDGFDFDKALDAAIYGESGFDPAAAVQDESVNDFSMSTQKAESEV